MLPVTPLTLALSIGGLGWLGVWVAWANLGFWWVGWVWDLGGFD